jgi:hypothetical protein
MQVSESSPSIDSADLSRIPDDEALALVAQHLGDPSAWAASAMLSHRLSADFQSDWKSEVGQWLHTAKTYRFLEKTIKPLIGERDRKSTNGTKDLNDPRHLKLHQHLAAAMTCRYLIGVGWSFVGHETETGGAIDIDLAMKTPDGNLVEIQVKAPGSLKGEQQILDSLAKAVEQLPKPSRSTAVVVMFAQLEGHDSLPGDPRPLLHQLYGSTYQCPGEVLLPHQDFGAFLTGGWEHVAGVIAIDILRGVHVVRYPCTVLLNMGATHPANPEWFPRSRVLVLEDKTFRWIRGEPWVRCTIPTGTKVVEALP